MDLALHFPCAYPLINQGIRRAKSANHLPIRDSLSLSFVLQNPSIEQSFSRTTINGERRIWLHEKASMGRSKKGYVCCKKPSNGGTSNQEEIISLLKRIQSSISKGESRGVDKKENRHVSSSEDKPLTKAILDVLEKSKTKTEGDTNVKEGTPKVSRPQSGFAKRTSIPSGPKGKHPVSNSNKALEDMPKKEEKASLMETMKLAELKEVAKNRGIKGYSKLKKSGLLELLRSS